MRAEPLRQDGRSLGIPAKTVNRQGAKRGQKTRESSGDMRLLAAAQRVMDDKGAILDKHGNERSAFKYRVAMCQRGLHGIPPAIYGNKRGDRAEFRDVQTCGSAWMCPVCAGKVTAGRRDDLSAMVSGWSACEGAAVYLLTYTHSHGRQSITIDQQRAAMQAAYKRLTNSKGYKALLKSVGCIGAVRAMEVTWGEVNGWHPHYHVLIFARAGQARALRRVRKLWVRELVRADLSGLSLGMVGREQREQLRHLMRRSVDIRDGAYAAEYVAKYGAEPTTDTGGRWGLASEMTKGHMKGRERLNGMTPFMLLRRYADHGSLWARDLFRDFALAFHGRRQLVASPGLRGKLIEAIASASCSLDMFTKARIINVLKKEKTDAALAAEPDRLCTEKIIRLSFDDWRLILMHQARADVLEVALAGADAVRAWLTMLRASGPPAFWQVHQQYEDDLARVPVTNPEWMREFPSGRFSARAA